MADRKDLAVPIRAQADALDRVRAVCRDVKYLLPGQRRFHRAIELARCDRRQNGISIHPQLGSEATADVAAHKPHISGSIFNVLATESRP